MGITRQKVLEHYKKFFNFDDVLDENEQLMIDWGMALFDDLSENKCHGKMWNCIHKPGDDFHCASCEHWHK
jgi:hypothetical protein